jgi:hypothetical protein
VLPHADAIFDGIPDCSIERDDARVRRADLQINLGAAEARQAGFRSPDQHGADTGSPCGRAHCQAMDPAAHSVESRHHGPDEDLISDRNQEELGLHSKLSIDHVRCDIVCGLIGKRFGPELYDGSTVFVPEWSNLKCHSALGRYDAGRILLCAGR